MLSKRHYTIPVFIPELACPFQCAFCNQRKISGQTHIPTEEEVIKTINVYLNSFSSENRNVEVGFFGGSFTGLGLKEQRHFLELVQPYLQEGKVDSIRLSTRPDYISTENLELLKEMNVGTIELGAQSFDDEVLKKARRGHSAAAISESSKMIRRFGFNLGLQMMIGLPGDSLEKAVNTARMIVNEDAENTRIYPALVVKDTLMYDWYLNGKYSPLSMEEAIDWTAKLILIFEEGNVKLIRVGLHPSDGLLSGDDYVAGPFHTSFRELVLSRIWRDIIQDAIPHDSQGSLYIEVSPKELNFAIGHGKSNKHWLEQSFDHVKFVPNENLSGRAIKIHEP